MTARMTRTAWSRGLTNAMICSFVIVVVLGLSTAGQMLLFQQSFSFSLLISYLVFMALILLAFVAAWLYGRARRGPVLRDCGTHPSRWLFVFNAAFFLFFGLTTGADTFTEKFNLYRTGVAVFFLAFGVYWLVMASGRLQICENGLWLYWDLMPWHRIGRYEWKNDTLLLERTGRFALLRKGAVPVASVDQPAVEELLQQHVQGAPEPSVEQPA